MCLTKAMGRINVSNLNSQEKLYNQSFGQRFLGHLAIRIWLLVVQKRQKAALQSLKVEPSRKHRLMTYDLHDKIVFITGAAQGIGAATARLCAERGARVVLADMNPAGEDV